MASITKLKEKAHKYHNAGKLAKAATVYAQLAELEPKNARWPHKLGELEQRLGKPSLAVAALERAVALHAEGGFLLKAIALCRQILNIDESHERTQTMLAELYAKKGGGAPRSPKPVEAQPVTPAPRPPTGETAPPARPSAPPPPRAVAVSAPPPPPSPSPVIEFEAEEPPAPEVQALELEAQTPPARAAESDISLELGESLDVIHLSEVLEGTSTPPPVPDSAAGPPVFHVALDETGNHRALDGSPQAPALDELPETPLFSALGPDALRSLIEQIEVRQVEPGEAIVREGTEGGGLFVLVEGRVGVYREGPPRTTLDELDEGAFFGEIALISKRARTATVEALEACTVLEISRELVARLIEKHPPVLKVMLRFFRQRLVNTLVETHQLFGPFSGDDRQDLARRFDFVEVEAGTELAICGEKVDGLYVVLSGRLCGENELGASFEIATGDVFGESSLLSAGPSPFSVTSRTRAWLLKLDDRAFREVIMTHPHVLEVISTLSDEKLQEDGRVGAESMIVVL